MNNESVFQLVIEALNEKKAQDVKGIDISELTTIAQYFMWQRYIHDPYQDACRSCGGKTQ